MLMGMFMRIRCVGVVDHRAALVFRCRFLETLEVHMRVTIVTDVNR